MKATHVIAALAAIALGVGLGLALSGPHSQPESVPRERAAAAGKQPASGAEPHAGREAPSVGIAATPHLPPARNLFADYQLALGSSDLREIERGLAAARSCVGVVGEGTEDIDTFVSYVIPPGLSREEAHRRGQFVRASLARCADFALQAGAIAQVGSLSDKALAINSASERLARLSYEYDMSPRFEQPLREASCDVVRDHPHSAGNNIRMIVLAAHAAAQGRPSHMLNQVDRPVRNVALRLANCDLDPASCERLASRDIGSACVQAGKCDYANELDYWRAETPPAVYASAQALRQRWVQAVRQGDCAALFE